MDPGIHRILDSTGHWQGLMIKQFVFLHRVLIQNIWPQDCHSLLRFDGVVPQEAELCPSSAKVIAEINQESEDSGTTGPILLVLDLVGMLAVLFPILVLEDLERF